MNYYLFQETNQVSVIHKQDDGSMVVFPTLSDGPEYKAYLAWVAEGNEATEWNPA